MAELSVSNFRDHLLDEEVLDPEGVHHEFVSGLHGRKLDFDTIPSDSRLFEEWVEAVARRVHELYIAENAGKIVLVSVANGTNRLVPIVAAEVGHKVVGVLTAKESAKSVKLLPESVEAIKAIKPEVAVAIEDVGTRGTTSASAVSDVRRLNVPRVEALNTWQRRQQLEELEAIGAPYNAVIFEPLPSLSPAECRATGYCAYGWEFIEHEQ